MEQQFPSPKNRTFGIIALLSDTIDGGPWMGRHQILSRMAKDYPVVWINPAIEWRSLLFDPTLSSKDKHTGFSQHGSGLTIFNPGFFLPELYKPRSIGRWFEKTRLKLAYRYLKKQGCSHIVFYLTHPDQAEALNLCQHDLSCYHVFDNFSCSETKTHLDPTEQQLIDTCDLPVFSSYQLMKEKAANHTHALHSPSGVDTALFSKHYDEPADLKAIPHPRIGYCGVIKKQLDLDLMYSIASKKTEWIFVFVGPEGNTQGCADALQKLKQLSNVHFLGPKDPKTLPAYIQHFDVATMCYRKNHYSESISPLKLHEYIICKKPIVSTPIPCVVELSEHIQCASNEKEWIEAINTCLREKPLTPTSTSLPFDWNRLTARLLDTINKQLIKKIDPKSRLIKN